MPYLQRFTSLAATLCLAAVVSPDYSGDWCAAVRSSLHPLMSEQEAADRALIEQHPVCIGSRIWSAGTMADTVFYEYRRHGDHLTVGYFVHWSTERPWGSNGLTYGVIPALFVDAFYSHTFFLLPGARELLYGPGDIEGASVTYRQEPDGKLVPIGGIADDDTHNTVQLSAEDLDAGGRTALVTETWSHQLGGKGGAGLLRQVIAERGEPTDGSDGPVRCFSGDKLQPLPPSVARTFRLGSAEEPKRAKPAWHIGVVHDDSWSRLATRE